MKEKIYSSIFVALLSGFMIVSLILPDKDVSISERRKLAQFPQFNIEELLEGEFFSDLNDYFVEQFPLRDQFRSLKGFVATNIFKKAENNGVFIKDGYMYQLDDQLNEKSVNHILKLINKINDTYITSNNVYYGIIPDKNYYLTDPSIPKLDYEKLENDFANNLKDMTYIDLFETLTLDSYYSTDIHWRQEKLQGVVDKITTTMNSDKVNLPSSSKTYDEFYGALYGRIASSLPADKLTYLSNDIINDATVFNYEKNQYYKVYEESHLSHIDPYDVYLSGASALLVIENKQQSNGKELVVFRDSFSSSLMPLLIENYSKITMVDLRYISSDLLGQVDIIDFNENQDVLFLYSTPVINSSLTLK